MAGSQLRTLWDKLLSPFRQVEKRFLQHEIDVHRLFLLTSFNRLGPEGHDRVEEIQSKANESSFESQQAAVQKNVHNQITSMAEVLDNILLKTPRERVEGERTRRRSGLRLAIGGVHQELRAEIAETWPLTRSQVSVRFFQRLGFTLECKPSSISHEEAGDGLFIRGKAQPGTVVAMYPGIIYTPSQYRFMPNYPRVDKDNPYLISRYDGLILDGKPWGRGGDERIWWDGADDSDASHHQKATTEAAEGSPSGSGGGLGQKPGSGRDLWDVIAKAKNDPVPWPGIARAVVERRNPLALGHFANHPPKDTKPNVLVCAYSAIAPPNNDKLRPYVPNLVLATNDQPMERSGLLWMRQWGRSSRDQAMAVGHRASDVVIRSLVLVAARTLEDEELLLNYRLSSHVKPPEWFHSIDEAEDQRRWE